MKGTYQSDNDFLLSAVQRGDQKAFDTLFRRYYPMLCAYGHRFVELEDAEEIVEDSLLWIWENRETLVIDSSLINPEKPDVPLNKNDAFQKVQKRRVQEKR